MKVDDCSMIDEFTMMARVLLPPSLSGVDNVFAGGQVQVRECNCRRIKHAPSLPCNLKLSCHLMPSVPINRSPLLPCAILAVRSPLEENQEGSKQARRPCASPLSPRARIQSTNDIRRSGSAKRRRAVSQEWICQTDAALRSFLIKNDTSPIPLGNFPSP